MATISKLPSGSWRVQVRRKGKYVSDTFLRRGDAERWGRTIEGKIDRGEPLHLSSETAKTFGDLVDLHEADLADVGQKLGRSKAASLAFLSDRLAPIAHDSGTLRGKRTIGGGRRLLRHVMLQTALVASHHNPVLKDFADRLRTAGKPHKAVITTVARMLVTIVNALVKSGQNWAPHTV